METRINYWRFMRMNADGTYRSLEVSEARTFFDQQFSASELATAADETVQHRLLSILQDESKPEQTRSLAERCLRCLISNQIHHVCQQLASQFGAAHGFTAADLYPYVLTDVSPNPSRSPSQHLSLISEILESYRPDKGSLSSWSIRRVRHHRELNTFLLECGVYLVSDWAILNDTSLGQVGRIFSEMYNLTPAEIQEACAVLTVYHAVYRGDRIQQRLQGRGARRCEAPTDTQWEQMRLRLRTQPCFADVDLTVDQVQHRVQHLAKLLRDYRIYIRVGRMRTESLDQPEMAAIANQSLVSQSADRDDEDRETQNQFLTQYRTQFSQALDEALAIAVDARVAKLRRRKPPVDHHYLTAMMLFHCQGMAMKDIAGHVELQKQFQVSRLMDLKPLRARVREEMLCRLRDRVPALAQAFVSPDQLKQLSQTLEAALDDEIVRLIEEAEAEANAVNRSAAPKRQFTRHLCRHLDTRSSKQ